MAGILDRTEATMAHTLERGSVADLPAFSDGDYQRQARHGTDFVYNVGDCFCSARATRTKMVAGRGPRLLAWHVAKNSARRVDLVHHRRCPLFFSESTRDTAHVLASY